MNQLSIGRQQCCGTLLEHRNHSIHCPVFQGHRDPAILNARKLAHARLLNPRLYLWAKP